MNTFLLKTLDLGRCRCLRRWPGCWGCTASRRSWRRCPSSIAIPPPTKCAAPHATPVVLDVLWSDCRQPKRRTTSICVHFALSSFYCLQLRWLSQRPSCRMRQVRQSCMLCGLDGQRSVEATNKLARTRKE